MNDEFPEEAFSEQFLGKSRMKKKMLPHTRELNYGDSHLIDLFS